MIIDRDLALSLANDAIVADSIRGRGKPSWDKLLELDAEVLRTAQEAIDNLNALYSDILYAPVRLSSKPSPDQEDPPLPPIQVDELDFERNMTGLLRRKYPNARKTLLEQLAASIVDRKRRISQRLQDFKDTGYGRGDGDWDNEEGILYRRQQILERLEPYICLSEICYNPVRYFRLFRDWANHMDTSHSTQWPSLIHTSSWYCDSEHPHKMIFEDQEAFESHMYDALLHPRGGRPSYRQLASSSRRQKTTISRDPFVCPFCEDVPEEVAQIRDTFGLFDSSRTWSSLYGHIGDHVQSLSHLSHPLLDAEYDPKGQEVDVNLNSSSETSLDNDVARSSLCSNIHSSFSSYLHTPHDFDKGGLPYEHAECGVLGFQDTEIPDIINTEDLATLHSIWSKKLKDIDPSMALHFQKHRDNVVRKDLQTRIAKARVESAIDHRKFVPVTSIHDLFTQEAVRFELSRREIDSRQLFQYVLQKCPKIFLILVYIERVPLIKDLVNEDFTDASLPVTFKENDQGQVTVVSSKHVSSKTLSAWSYIEANDFYEAQWAFLAPVFSDDIFVYDLHDQCPLPFFMADRDSEKMSAFSIVRKVTIYPGHMKFNSLDDLQAVAVKQLSPEFTRPDREAEAQMSIRALNHKHLIKSLAVFKIRGSQTFIFPWAQGGNLRDTWQHLDDLRIRNETLVSWVLHQLRGLSSALRLLHSRSWRHGDLKPENILRFQAHDDLGVLVIADMGLAKFHNRSTRERKSGTGTTYGTLRYEHPEGSMNSIKAVSRRSDVWSFGCVAMEFIIWLLYGYEELERFEGEAASFFCFNQNRVKVHPNTIRWSDHMMRDPRCRSGTALRDLLELIRERLLVFENPAGFEENNCVLGTIFFPSDSVKDEAVLRSATERDDDTHASIQDDGTAVASRGRADSEELFEELSAIVKRASPESDSQGLRWNEMGYMAGPKDKTALIGYRF
ncbi:hypothetical protein F5Y10DRAFT_34090 [Nemania abortiva]|nr:hypothetical protein F5Y10DRAFT_34090 [Nemania abortiva]